jgi:hypothetical protein
MPSNESALTAVAGVKRIAPLPAACPDDRAFFTVTFYYGERPAGGALSAD